MEDNFSFRLKLAMNRKGIKPVQLASLTGLKYMKVYQEKVKELFGEVL